MDKITYRIWCEDGPRHDSVPESRLAALVSTGHLDLEDRIAPVGTEDWQIAAGFDGLFEACVVHAYQKHSPALGRMHRSIRGEWITLMEYRKQRDHMLLQEPGVNNTRWIDRPRPDLVRTKTQSDLERAASEGADAQRRADQKRPPSAQPVATRREVAQPAEAGMESLQHNIQQLMQGDIPEWIEPRSIARAWRAQFLSAMTFAILATVLLDPLEPFLPSLRWVVVLLGLGAMGSALRQLASPPRNQTWARRFTWMVLTLLVTSALLVVRGEIDPERGAAAHFFPRIASWQDEMARKFQPTLVPPPAVAR